MSSKNPPRMLYFLYSFFHVFGRGRISSCLQYLGPVADKHLYRYISKFIVSLHIAFLYIAFFDILYTSLPLHWPSCLSVSPLPFLAPTTLMALYPSTARPYSFIGHLALSISLLPVLFPTPVTLFYPSLHCPSLHLHWYLTAPSIPQLPVHPPSPVSFHSSTVCPYPYTGHLTSFVTLLAIPNPPPGITLQPSLHRPSLPLRRSSRSLHPSTAHAYLFNRLSPFL